MKNALYWLWLQKSVGFHANIRELVRYFGSAEHIYNANENELRTSGLFGYDSFEINPRKILDMQKKSLSYAESMLRQCDERRINIVTPEDESYPNALKRIMDFPAVLYVRGDMSCINQNLVLGVIGTRHPSAYGEQACEKIVRGLAKESTVIVSGGALGIDSISHRCTIESDGKTILVMGCGHDTDYLRENDELRMLVEQNGAVITEYPPLTKASLFSFPKRNRIISGLSKGIVVIEAGEKSGTLNTAKHAENQGRDIFAVPGDIESEAYSGSNKLISDGAKAVFSASDILETYNYESTAINEIHKKQPLTPFELVNEFAYGKPNLKKNSKTKPSESLKREDSRENSKEEAKKISNFDTESVSNNAKLVYNLLLGGLKSLDEITRMSGLPVRKVLTALTELEIAGAAQQQSGNQYVLV
ncbi:MAG: DNA-processing protein DprA [Ruminococcus sp.]|nr:DNA-processing protein DprA [Ruminococcus sp.]